MDKFTESALPGGKASDQSKFSRRSFLKGVGGVAGTAALMGAPFRSDAQPSEPAIDPTDNLKVTKLETMLVKPRWSFLKIHTNAGIIGLGEPALSGRAKAVLEVVKRVEPYLVGKDPRRVVYHWEAIYRDAFFRGGPILTSALSGIDQALWDIKGKALGVPVYELLGGPTRDKIRVYAHVGSDPNRVKKAIRQGFNCFKAGVARKDPYNIIASPAEIDYAVEKFAGLREAAGPKANIGIDFHGSMAPQTSKVLIEKYAPYQPYFIEEPVLPQNLDYYVELKSNNHIPIAGGERWYGKWEFRKVLERGAVDILQPDLCHAGGITEVRLIAGMAEAYYVPIAPHNPLGPISLASGLQIAASIPNFLIQEQVSLGKGYIREPFEVKDGYISLPKKPGLGIELDEDALEDKIVDNLEWHNPHERREDGSVVLNW
jgi:galactonate dehydratase